MSELGTANLVKHSINTGDSPPIKLPFRRTPHSLKLAIKEQIDDMQRHNVIRESTSPYAAPVVMVPKKGGELRFCIDYRQLNKSTVKDSYPLPRIDDTIDALHGAQYFTTLDLFSGYWQIEIEEQDKHKTAFVCEFGQYEFNRMPFGLTNAPATFQRLMNKILKPVLYETALVYLDDIIVFSKTIDEHIDSLEQVFKLLASAGLKLKLKKCEFLKNKINFLGHIVSSEGVMPDDKKINSILEYPVPKNVKELLSFIGLASYYRKFIRAFAEKAHSLTKLTRKNEKWEWGNEQDHAFNCIRTALTSQPILKYPDFTREFIIYTDASGFGIGAVLAQIQHSPQTNSDEEVVIAYSSKHLNDRQAKWSTTEKEALAIIHAIEVFKPYLYGRKFTVYTDHKPLEWLMSKVEPSGRLARWALKIQEYDIVIGYRTGKSNQNADSLSRIPLLSIATLTLKTESDWIQAQSCDIFCKRYKENLEKLNLPKKEGILKDNQGKIIVPETMKQLVLEINHDHMLAGHLGVAKTLLKIKRQFTWPSIAKDVKQYVKSCLQCARRKALGTSKAPLQPLLPSERVWERIAMDVVGPLPESTEGNKYILVLSDYASRYALTIAMEDQKAKTIAFHLADKIISKYGAPEKVLTDQGTNFLSKLVEEICTLFKIKQLRTTSYHPQTDGLVERFNRTLCDMLSCYVSEEPDNWDKYLPFVTLAYNSSEQSTLKNNPFYLFYGRQPNLPSDIIIVNQEDEEDENIKFQWKKSIDLAQSNLKKAQEKQKQYYDKDTKIISYKEKQLVLLKAPPAPGKFNPRWNGPFMIIKKLNDLNYSIRKHPPTEKDRFFTVHVNRIKLLPQRTVNIEKTETDFPTANKKQQKKLGRRKVKVRIQPQRITKEKQVKSKITDNAARHVGRPRKKTLSLSIPNTSSIQSPSLSLRIPSQVQNAAGTLRRGPGRPRKTVQRENFPSPSFRPARPRFQHFPTANFAPNQNFESFSNQQNNIQTANNPYNLRRNRKIVNPLFQPNNSFVETNNIINRNPQMNRPLFQIPYNDLPHRYETRSRIPKINHLY